MSILAVIPARGGSKGIPRKNLVPVAGRPLITWTISAALAAGADLHVMVSTDDEEIAEVSAAAGARVIERPDELAQDETPTEPVVLHALDAATSQGLSPRAVMLLQATSPVRLPGTLDRAVAQFEDTGVDSLVGVVPSTPFIWRVRADGLGQAAYDVANRPRRQDLTPKTMRYRETGSIYLTDPLIYGREHNRLGGRIGVFVMDEVEGIDIDTAGDLALAEHTLRTLHPAMKDAAPS